MIVDDILERTIIDLYDKYRFDKNLLERVYAKVLVMMDLLHNDGKLMSAAIVVACTLVGVPITLEMFPNLDPKHFVTIAKILWSPQTFDPYRGFTRGKILGRSNSTVFEATFADDATDTTYAVKAFESTPNGFPLEFLVEIITLKAVGGNPYTCNVIGAFLVDTQCCIIMQHYQMTLAEFSSCVALTTDYMQQTTTQLMLAVEAAHEHLAHRDIKPQNIMVKSIDEIALCDWDSSTVSQSPSKTNPVCTLPYRAPELLLHGQESCYYDSRKLDVWSAGCVLLSMLNKGKAWYNGRHEEEVLQKIIDNQNKWPTDDERIIKLLRGMLHINPDKRYTASQCLAYLDNISFRGDDVH